MSEIIIAFALICQARPIVKYISVQEIQKKQKVCVAELFSCYSSQNTMGNTWKAVNNCLKTTTN